MPRKKLTPIDRALKAGLRVAPQVEVAEDTLRELVAYLTTAVADAKRHRDAILPRVEKWRKTIRGERASGIIRSTASNLSVPLTTWARTAVRARLTESILESSPMLTVQPTPGRSVPEQARSSQTRANSIARFLSAQILNPRALNGREVIEQLSAEATDFGASAYKIIPVRDTVRKIAVGEGAPSPTIIPGGVRWEFVSLLDLIWVRGYGTDTQRMPFVGHQIERMWAEIEAFGRMGHYNEEAVKKVKNAYRTGNGAMDYSPELLRPHDIDEIYLDWDIDNDGIMESLIVDWHPKAAQCLRINWNPIPNGRRPILVGRFDFGDDLTDLNGQGVCAKLEGPQDEADAIHNIAIEAGKRGTAHIIVLKAGTRAEDEFGGETDILPGEVIVTENPKEDVVAVPMGAVDAALAAIQIEEHTRLYVTRLLGMDESRVGNVESGKRVTAAVGMASMREGRMIIKAALTSLANIINEGCYLTLELYRQRIPLAAMRAALSPEEVDDVMEAVFTLSSDNVRDAYQIRINAQDAAISEQTRKQEMLVINQALFPFYDRMAQYIVQLNDPMLPPGARKPMLVLIERMERGIEALLNTVESIPNPEELMIRVGELSKMIDAGGAGSGAEEPAPDAATSAIGDLGAGVV